MRVVGYIRETGDPEADTAYAQSERIRRWIAETGHQLVAVCQDVPARGATFGHDGWRALVRIVAAGDADGVILPDLATLSADKVEQEIMLWDLRSRGAAVASTAEDDHIQLEDPPADRTRLFLRDVLHKAMEYRDEMRIGAEPPAEPPVIRVEEVSDVIVELIPPERSLGVAGGEPVSPAG